MVRRQHDRDERARKQQEQPREQHRVDAARLPVTRRTAPVAPGLGRVDWRRRERHRDSRHLTVNLLLLEPDELDARGRATLDDSRARHLLGVLRVVPDQTVRIGVVDGGSGTGRVLAAAAGRVTLECTIDAAPRRPAVDLLLAVPRPKVLRRLWAQLAALGAGRIILTNAARVERNYFDTHLLEPAGYRPLLLEGLQQARDTQLPIVSVHRQFRILVEDHLDALTGPSLRVVADPSAGEPIAGVAAREHGQRILLAIGPEGGWNGFELELLGAHGFHAVGLGPRTLRSDTACVALLALAHEALRGRSLAIEGAVSGEGFQGSTPTGTDRT